VIIPSIPPQDSCDLSWITGRVYVASSLHTFDTPRYNTELARIREHFPHAEIVPARGLFGSNAHWKRRWPDILTTIDALVFFADDDGYVGLGVWTELCHADERGIPIWYQAPHGRLYEFGDSDAVEVSLRPWDSKQFAMIAYKLSAEEALAMVKGGE
jgi:hypothetical protein